MKRKSAIIILLTLLCLHSHAQTATRLTDGIEASWEASGVASSGDFAPLWISSNKHGIVSPYGNSAYEGIALNRDTSMDSLYNWKFGYGVELLLKQNATSSFNIQQAYAQVGYKGITLTLGAKEREIDLRNNELTSGGLSLGTNATPLPMAMVDLDYFSIPHTNDWWKWRMRLGYGFTTDGNWQKRWVGDTSTMRYTSNVLYNEKALYWKFGNEKHTPLSFEIGLQMMCLFGGTTYNAVGRGIKDSETIHHPADLHAFWAALMPIGTKDATDGVNHNAQGNTLGSYNMRLQWKTADWSVGAYFERFFEDHSMLTVQYGIYDHLIGVDATLPKNKIVSNILVEHISTKDQSGAVYHDGTANMPDAIAGRDNYYNHRLYAGWQHWGMGIGNPLLISPIYNADHNLLFVSNRMQAWHIGLSGKPSAELHWRTLASFTKHWGSYAFPLPDIVNESHLLAEVTYQPKWASNSCATLAVGSTHSKLVDNTIGTQLTIRKRFSIK